MGGNCEPIIFIKTWKPGLLKPEKNRAKATVNAALGIRQNGGREEYSIETAGL